MSTEREKAKVLVLGREDFHTGIGTVTASALEMFARRGAVDFYPLRGDRSPRSVSLASGRQIPVVGDSDGYEVSFFTDVLWNGSTDFGYRQVSKDGRRIAHIAYDSDELPREWVEILNENFDLALFSSAYLEDVARESGVKIDVGSLPIALEFEDLIARRYSSPIPGRIRFGTVSAFHDRKNLDILVDAFLTAFGNDKRAELVIHSNLAMGDTYGRLASRLALDSGHRVTLSHGNISTSDKDALIDSFDVYVNVSAGEGYSIGPREALALGKPLVVSDVPAHRELGGVEGVFLVPSRGLAPALYREIDNRIFGRQQVFVVTDVVKGLLDARSYVAQGADMVAVDDRKMVASQFSATVLEADYRRVVDPDAPQKPGQAGSSFTNLPDSAVEVARVAAGRVGGRVGRRRIVLPAHDGGFFSLFNAYASHLVWAQQDGSPAMVLPDWDSGRLLQRPRGGAIRSYCYSRPEDGNLWVKLFEPLYGLSDDDYNNPEVLYEGAEIPKEGFNESKEPLLTYVNAFDLYRSPWFGEFRTQYASVIRDQVHLRQEYLSELAAMEERRGDRYRISVHVKHPSHAIEQPNGLIAGEERYEQEVRAALARRGIPEGSEDWSLFVATDQDRVVRHFVDVFGDHVTRVDDVARIDEETDAAFTSLDEGSRAQEGFQLQHLMAAETSKWSVRLAWEVWRDAEAMASSNVLIHAVSNVSTAVSYLGPDVEMVYCDPEVLA